MSNLITKYNLYISSSQRDQGDPSNFSINLPQSITLTKDRNSYFMVYIQQACIPFAFNQWNSLNNRTYINLNQGGKSFDGYFDVAQGNADIITFMENWKSSLEQELGVLNAYFPNIGYSYSAYNNKVTITLPYDGSGTVITFYNQTGATAVNRAIGFTSQWTLTEGATAVTSTICININPARTLYMYSDTMSSTTNYEAITSPMTTSSQLCAIPITVLPNDYIEYQPFNLIKTIIKNRTFSKLNFQIQSEDLPPQYNLQAFTQDYSFLFVIEEYDRFDPQMGLLKHFETLKQENTMKEIDQIERQKQILLEERMKAMMDIEKEKFKLMSDDTIKDDNTKSKRSRRKRKDQTVRSDSAATTKTDYQGGEEGRDGTQGGGNDNDRTGENKTQEAET